MIRVFVFIFLFLYPPWVIEVQKITTRHSCIATLRWSTKRRKKKLDAYANILHMVVRPTQNGSQGGISSNTLTEIKFGALLHRAEVQ